MEQNGFGGAIGASVGCRTIVGETNGGARGAMPGDEMATGLPATGLFPLPGATGAGPIVGSCTTGLFVTGLPPAIGATTGGAAGV
jgi:hypothetical protein